MLDWAGNLCLMLNLPKLRWQVFPAVHVAVLLYAPAADSKLAAGFAVGLALRRASVGKGFR